MSLEPFHVSVFWNKWNILSTSGFFCVNEKLWDNSYDPFIPEKNLGFYEA